MHLRDERGVALRTKFFVENDHGTSTIVLESAGGAEARDYREVLELLLQRLATAGAVLTDGVVDSRVAQALPDADRRLILRHGRRYPINLRTVDIDELRKAIGAAQEHVGQRPGATAGNRTKRIRLMIAPGLSPLPENLEHYLSTGRREPSPHVASTVGSVAQHDKTHPARRPVERSLPGSTRIVAVAKPVAAQAGSGSSDHAEGAALTDDVSSLGRLTTGALLALSRAILSELRDRGVVRTGNAPAGDYAEYLVQHATGGELAPNSQKGWDIATPDGDRLQVKARVVTDPRVRGERQLSVFRSWDFDAALIVLFDDRFNIWRAARVNVAILRDNARFVKHVSGYRILATDDLLTAGEDWTERLRAFVS